MSEPQNKTLPAFEAKSAVSGKRHGHLIVSLECDRPFVLSERFCLTDLDLVTFGRGDGERTATRRKDGDKNILDVRIPDPRISQVHAQLRRVLGAWVLEDLESRNGTFLNGAPCKSEQLADGDEPACGQTRFLFREGEFSGCDRGLAADVELRTFSTALAARFSALEAVAPSMVSVILHGETGTGKERVAQVVHRLSKRSGALVAVNCGALPPTLIEAELFGCKKGAFSGATEDRIGLVRSADRGTLFLDEIGDLPLSSQTAFLRALEEREVHPVGATKPVEVDFRLLAATHRDLNALVADGKFRGDLLARISGFTVKLPPLRDRHEDLGLLIAVILDRVATDAKIAREKIRLTAAATDAMYEYGWPFNIRELRKALEAAVVLAAGAPIDLAHLPESLRAPALSTNAGSRSGADAAPALSAEDQKRRAELVELLQRHGGNISQVAREMGKARNQIQRWIKRFRLSPAT